MTLELPQLPAEVQVEELLSSRYSSGERPASWDERQAGEDLVRTSEGQTLKLWSEGGQSPPRCGWRIILRSGTKESGYRWTLYSLPL